MAKTEKARLQIATYENSSFSFDGFIFFIYLPEVSKLKIREKWEIISRISIIIIRCKRFVLFNGRKPTTWPANNCLQIMVCSCAMSFNCFWLHEVFGCKYYSVHAQMKPRFSPSCDRSCVQMADRFTSRRYYLKNKLGDRMIKQLLNTVIAKYRDSSVSRRSIICLSLRLRQIIDLLATDKLRYFAQPRPIIAN